MGLRWSLLSLSAALTVVNVVVVTGLFMIFSHVSLTMNLLSILILGLAALMVLAFWTWHVVIQPSRRRLYALEEAASLIASGRLHHRIESMGESDEIGRVAEQFNVMGEKIEQQVKLLQKLAEENQTLANDAERLATVSERQRLARELHDSVSQQLFAIAMLAASAERQYASGAEKLPVTLHQLSDLANAAQREMRALLLHLRPVELDGRSLQDAMTAFLAAVQERHQIRCVLEFGAHESLSVSVEEQLFRILQEAVANVLKHADAGELKVRLHHEHRLLLLSVLDDGRGIAPDAVTSQGDSYGLRAMRERAVQLGGQLEVWRRDRGTAVEVKIPIV